MLARQSYEDWLGVPAFPQMVDVDRVSALHPADAFAADLASHVACAEGEQSQRCALYLLRAGLFARGHDDAEQAARMFLAAAQCGELDANNQRRARLQAINELILCGKLEAAEEQILILCQHARAAGDVESEVRAENALAGIRWNRGRIDLAEEILRRTLYRATEAGRIDLANECEGGIGVLLCDSGRAKAALAHLDAAVVHFRKTAAPVRVAMNLGNLALCYVRLEDFEQARKLYDEALAISLKEGARRREGLLLCGMGDLLRRSGQSDSAETYYNRALALLRETGDQRGEVIALNNFANLLSLSNRRPHEQELRQRALSMACEIGNPMLEQLTLTGLGAFHAKEGRHEESVAPLLRSVEMARVLGIGLREAMSSCELLYSLVALRRFEEARTLTSRVFELCDRGMDGAYRFRALACLARIEEGEGNLERAEQRFNEALALPVHSDSHEAREVERLGLALLLVKLGKLDAARAQWREGLKRVRGFASPEFVEARVNEMRAACEAAGVPPLDES